jgi:large subunit ribosomal protein L23
MMQAHHIIKKPLLTEKSTIASNEFNRHLFEVDPRATKTEIKDAIQQLYKVRVVGVSTSNLLGRDRQYRYGAIAGKMSKRAYVRVHPDDTLEIL